jgi:hypothetical protein
VLLPALVNSERPGRYVLLSAVSLKTIKQTHSSYFNGSSRHLEELLPG